MIYMEEVNSSNIWSLIKLKVDSDQENFVATNTESILEAYVTITDNKPALPFGIFNDKNEAVGFLLLGYGRVYEDDPKLSDENYVLWRLMIDREHQGKGYGREALSLAIDYLRKNNKYGAKHCWISYEATNEVARQMYFNFGFRETGEVSDGEIVAVIDL